jgi:hypothetical protein
MSNTLSVSSYSDGSLLRPTDAVRFRIRSLEFEQPIESTTIKFEVPQWSARIDSVDATYTKSDSLIIKYNTNNEYRILSFARYNIPNTQDKRLLLRLTTEPKNVTVGNTILLTASSGSLLNGANTQEFRVIKSTKNNTVTTPATTGAKNIDIRIADGVIGSTSGTVNPNSNSIITKIDKIQRTTIVSAITQPDKLSLINQDNVKDILIFTYTRTTDNPNATEQKYLLMGPGQTQVSESSPPQYSSVSSMIGKIATTFETDDINLPIFNIYVAIARYVNNGNNWTGSWLQTENGNAIWQKLKSSGGA